VFHGVAACDPASGAPASPSQERPSGRRFRGPLPSIPDSAALPQPPGCPGRWTDRVRRLSTSAITTVLEHDRRTDLHPARPALSCLSALRLMRAASRLAARRWPSRRQTQGPTSAFQRSRRLPTREAWGLIPDPGRSGHLMSQTRVHPDRSSQRRWLGTKSPRARRRTTQAPSAQGLHHPAFREESQDPRTRGAFPSMGGSEEPTPVVHKLSPTCGVTGCGAFFIDVSSPRALTGPGVPTTRPLW
jgi:hypothetical protein